MAAALSAALLTIAGPGNAQSIVNTARATWVQGGEARWTSSNQVTTPLDASAVAIDLLHPVVGSILTAAPASLCGGKPLSLLPMGGPSDGLALPAAAADTLRVGEILLAEVNAPLANRDKSRIELLDVKVLSKSGDSEAITLQETGPDTGIFRGAIRTVSIPPSPVVGDCRLSVHAGDLVQVTVNAEQAGAAASSRSVLILADPFGIVFDSKDGRPVSGARVTIVDAVTGQPAPVFAEDGVTPWPSSVISGKPVTDAAGTVYPMAPGEYRFPLMYLSSYRIKVEPPAPYAAPSVATPAALASLARPDGKAFDISVASFGGAFTLVTPDAVRVDLPIDRPTAGATITKTASRDRLQPGDLVTYTVDVANPDVSHAQTATTIIDTPSPWLRLRPETLRIDGKPAPQALTIAADARSFTIHPGNIPAGTSRRITYAMSLRADVPAGQVVNRARASDPLGNTALAEAVVRVERDTIAARMTVVGRVVLGTCKPGETALGIPGVRVMMEDGSFAVTDRDGRYHFEGLVPGTHVVALAETTLPKGARPVDCDSSTRSAGSAVSRFVTGQGGTLAVADFMADIPGWTPPPAPATTDAARPDAAAATAFLLDTPTPAATSDRAAAGAETNWFSFGDGPTDFLFPTVDYNPRIPSIRAVIRHRNGQKIQLNINNQRVDSLAFEGTHSSPGAAYVVSVWRGIPLVGTRNVLSATVTNADGTVDKQLERVVQFVSAPWRAEIVPAQSRLVADGKSRPVVAVRFTDRQGRPVRSGVTGSFSLGEPYQSAAMLEQMQAGQLSGGGAQGGGGGASWTITTDDGVALIELAPTMVSGPLHLDFAFSDEDLTRQQKLEGWVVPGDLPFTLVGLAEGTVGAKSVAAQMERVSGFDSDLGDDARVAFYAKGRVPGKMLLTVAYDSAREKAAQALTGAIDPSAYYTIYADGSTRRFDAASTEKLYVRLEAKAFYAIYGDILTGFDQTELGRYQRSFTGAKLETRIGNFHATGYAAKVAGRHRRDEIQGGGISGPYALSDRDILANSERVAIEVRDRFRSEIVVSRRELVRFIDYDLDLLSGTISFKEPVLSRDFDLNPQFIVVDYEAADGLGDAQWNAGARADVTFGKRTEIRLGATAISDRGDGSRTSLGAVDVRARLGARTEVRAEAAVTRKNGVDAVAWLAEAEHHTGKLDVLAYARQADQGFGTGQQNAVELGRRKLGVDGRLALGENSSIVARSWFDDSLTDAAHRYGAEADFVYRGLSGEARIGLAHRSDHLADGRDATSTTLEGQATKRMLGNKLELGVGTSIALGASESIDLPTRHRFTARYAVADGIRLLGNYEIAHGDTIDSQNFNAGFEIAPWVGGRATATLGKQDIAEAGTRSYAAFGLAQSLPLGKAITIDATLDGNRKLGSADLYAAVNPLQPNSSGGQLTPEGAIYENFTAATLGLAWRVDAWSAVVRGEWRDGEFATRRGLTAGIVRQLGNGVTLGSGASWTRAEAATAATTEVVHAAVAAAYRPANSSFAGLGKLEYRSDKVTGGVLGGPSAAGQTALSIDGDGASRRLIASLSTNWQPQGEDDGRGVRRTEVGVFLGSRYNFDRTGAEGFASTALMGGLDARFGIGARVELGGSASVRANVTEGTTSFAYGPQVSVSPVANTLVTLGYNVTGFRDADFGSARHTDKGLYASVKIKFDSSSLGFLGLRR